ncbi:MAG: hypothetical protein CMK09_11785 [Ponticaulis sp.]|nr:hypothetical protein [Ponticaulis sp.]|tara:strand:+ start:15225 stop:15746 length:522 start_codon:yes stop_codon:yes gene_type:complete
MAKTLQTKRLVLRPLAAVDSTWLTDYWRLPELYRMAASIPPDVDEDFARQRIVDANEGEQAITSIARMIELDEQRVGLISLQRSTSREAYNLGYSVHPDHWGQGIATEAGTALLNWTDGFVTPRFYISGYFADNPTSGKVLTKLGFLPCWREDVFSRGRNEYVDHIFMSRMAE